MPRPRVIRATPVHVTVRLVPEVRQLRSTRRFRIIRRSLVRGGLRFGFRLVHYSVQSSHLHLIGEAPDARAVGRAMKGLGVRIARGLNGLLRRSGPVIAERYHLRVVRDPRHAHRTLAYVLNNLRRHMAQRGRKLPHDYLDECSSAPAFDGWKLESPACVAACRARDPCPELPLGVHPPRSSLLRDDWRKVGRLDPWIVPGDFESRARVGEII